jgi:hypothetical protein
VCVLYFADGRQEWFAEIEDSSDAETFCVSYPWVAVVVRLSGDKEDVLQMEVLCVCGLSIGQGEGVYVCGCHEVRVGTVW